MAVPRTQLVNQNTLVRLLYQACLAHDRAHQLDLLHAEFLKVFAHRAQGRSFDGTWTIVQG